ncbi:translocase [Pseudogemmobacter sp. W21_MBD1_M6]|uniref:translocase n=1 Tax=Pseudogemmobacter sp. W21_MBD1_M6 TaxID=3240271 RepID=UPI003F95549E
MTIGSAFILAASTGYVMQNGDVLTARLSGSAPVVSAELSPVPQPNPDSGMIANVTAVTLVALKTEAVPPVDPATAPGAMVLPRPPAEAMQPALLGATGNLGARLARVDGAATAPFVQGALSPYGLSCEPELSARETSAAMVSLTLSAPCHLGEWVTVSHAGLNATLQVSAAGMLVIDMPALTTSARFVARFADDDEATATVDVPDLALFDRVAVQWVGLSGLQLHALEFGAGYQDDGHVWINAPRTAVFAETARGGFLTRLGDETAPNPNMAEVYTFPTGKIRKDGTVRIRIEAEITAYNCAREVDAQSLQTTGYGPVSVIDLTLSMPECDAIGDFLVLKNVLRDLKIAQN